jgi:hypothetical protein
MALTRRQKNTVRDFFKRGIRYLVEIQTYLIYYFKSEAGKYRIYVPHQNS